MDHILEVLKKLKEHRKQVILDNQFPSPGLCINLTLMRSLNKISYIEKTEFKNWMWNQFSYREWFFDYEGNQTKKKSQFIWKAFDHESRDNWIDAQIEKLTLSNK